MLAVICDRCGYEKKINQIEISEEPMETNHTTEMPLIVFKKIRIDGIREDISRLSATHSMILCEECQQKLVNWLENRGEL